MQRTGMMKTSLRLLEDVREYWRRIRPGIWFLPGHCDHPIRQHQLCRRLVESTVE